jgi:hypothetical protein
MYYYNARCRVSFIGCLFLGGSSIGGSTVYRIVLALATQGEGLSGTL